MAGMQRGATISAVFHLVVILLAWFGLPQLIVQPPEPEKPIIIELAQIGDVTNPPPAPQIQQGEKEPEPPKPEPPKPEPAKPEPQKAPPPPPPPPPKPAEPAPPPEPAPAPKPKEKAPEPKPEAPKPSPLAEVKPKTKPEPPPDDFIKNVMKSVEKPKPQTQADDFDKMMKDLKKDSAKKDDKPQPPATPAKAQAGSPISTLSQQYSVTEQDFIKGYVQKNWSPPVGAKEVVVVKISFTLRTDGTITDVRYEDAKTSDNLWQSFADSARRAVLISSPIPIPAKTGRTDERVVMTFDPREMMGYSKGR